LLAMPQGLVEISTILENTQAGYRNAPPRLFYNFDQSFCGLGFHTYYWFRTRNSDAVPTKFVRCLCRIFRLGAKSTLRDLLRKVNLSWFLIACGG
jgi:hypothetical protein